MLQKDAEVSEYQIESQRGLFLFGMPLFSSKGLLPRDPAPFSTLQGAPLGNELNNYTCPDDTWEWVWPKWFVVMGKEVDDQGWTYSWRFGSKRWHFQGSSCRAFVRQRRWRRVRRKKPAPSIKDEAQPPEPQSPVCELFMELDKCRNDREKIHAIVEYISGHPAELTSLVEHSAKIFSSLKFEFSKLALVERMASNDNEVCQKWLEDTNSSGPNET